MAENKFIAHGGEVEPLGRKLSSIAQVATERGIQVKPCSNHFEVVALDAYAKCSLNRVNRDNQSLETTSFDENTLDAIERTAAYSNPLPFLEKGIRSPG